MRKRTIVLTGSALLVVMSVAGCLNKQTGGGEEVTIRMTYAVNELDGVNRDGDAVFADFYAKYPNCKVEFEEGGTSMMAKIASNDAPDIIRCTPADIPLYVNKNVAMPLDDLLEKSEMFNKDDIYDTALRVFQYDGLEFGKGSIYGLPKDWSPNVMWVNKAALAEKGLRIPTLEEPYTFSEMKQAAEMLTIKDGVNVKRFGILNDTSGFMDLTEYALNMDGKSMWSDDFKKINIDDDAKEIIRVWFDLFKNGNSPSSKYPLDAGGGQAITQDQVGLYLSALWSGSGMVNNPDATVDVENISLTPFPVSDKSKTPYSICTPTGSVISARTEHIDEVFACWEAIHLGKMSEMRAASGSNLPIQKSVAEKVSLDNPFMKQSLDSVLKLTENETLVPRVNPYVSGANATFNKYWSAALNGEYTLDEALKIIQEEIQILIDEGVQNQ